MESGSGSLEALREANRLRVIDALRHEGSASRTDLVRITGLSRTTITTLVGDLQERGLVVELEEDATDRPERPGRGRPPVLLRLAPSAGAALGVAAAKFVMKRRERADPRGEFSVRPMEGGTMLTYTVPMRR